MPTGLAVGLGRRGSPAWVGTTRVRPVYTGGARVGPPPRPMATGLGGRGHYRRDGAGTRPDGRSRPGRPGLRGGGRSAAVPAAGSVESRRCGVAHGAPAQPSSTPGCCARRPAARRRRPAGVDHRVPAGARGVHRIGVGDGGGAGHLPVAGEEPHPSVEWSQQAGGPTTKWRHQSVRSGASRLTSTPPACSPSTSTSNGRWPTRRGAQPHGCCSRSPSTTLDSTIVERCHG